MKIKIKDASGSTYEFRTTCESIFEVLLEIDKADEYVTFKVYNANHNYEYDHAINKNFIVAIEEINDSNQAFTKNTQGRRYTF
jgi:hypothetical protein